MARRPGSPLAVLALLPALATGCDGSPPASPPLPGDWRSPGDAFVPGGDLVLPDGDGVPTLWPPCGNNQLNGIEACDRTAFRVGPDCALYDAGTGQVGCTAQCTVDWSGCGPGPCTIGGWFDDDTCDACALSDGVPDPDCAEKCGDDGTCADYHDLMVGDWTCAAAGLGRDPNCPTCGNGVRNVGPGFYGEYCDGPDLNGKSCADYGYDSGALGCRADCTFDFGNCRFVTGGGSRCGDGLITGLEPCEQGFSDDCADYGFGSGTIRCTNDCQFDASGCSQRDVCAAQGWYEDGRCDLCELLGGHADPDCAGCGADATCVERFNVILGLWGCRSLGPPDPDCGSCGNNVGEEVEFCDGADLRGQTCAEWDFSRGGTLGCNFDCTLDFRRCLP